MTRAFLKSKDGKALSFDSFILNMRKGAKDMKELNADVDDIVENLLGPRHNSEAFGTAARLVRLHAEEHLKFYEKISKKFGSINLEYKDDKTILKYNILAVPHVVVNGKGQSEVKVRVFKNIPVNVTHLDVAEDETYTDTISRDMVAKVHWSDPWALSKFFDDMQVELNDDKKNKKWLPTARGIKAVKSYVEMSISKFVTQYTTVAVKSLKDSQIRDKSLWIEDIYKPIEVAYAETLKEFVECYETGYNSCMKSTSSSAGAWKHIYDKTKKFMDTDPEKVFHPVVWYYYHPAITMAYISSRGKNVLRSIVLEKDGQKYYTHPYCSNNMVKEKFMNEMTRIGAKYIQKGDGNTKLILNEDFTVPEISFDGTAYCPVPYLDAAKNVWSIEYISGEKAYKFTAKGKKPLKMPEWHRATTGFLTPYTLKQQRCEECGNNVEAGQAVVTVDNHMFCSYTHARDQGYVAAIDSERMNRYVNKNDAYKDLLATDTYYTNLAAAITCGAVPVITAYCLPETGDDVSAYGNDVSYKGIKYAISKSDHKKLIEANLMDNRNITALLSEKTDNININIVKGEYRIEV